jgi:hypothetical protein
MGIAGVKTRSSRLLAAALLIDYPGGIIGARHD